MRYFPFVALLLIPVLMLTGPIAAVAQEATPAAAAEPPGQPLQPARAPGVLTSLTTASALSTLVPGPSRTRAGPDSGSSSHWARTIPAPPSLT